MVRTPRAKRSLGQNFLVDPNIQRRIVDALDPRPSDTVLEIGPGTGALTRHLAGTVERLLAIELDDALAEALQRELGTTPGVEIVHANALELDLGRLLQGAAGAPSPKIIGNIPYNITTPLIFHLLDTEPRPETVVLMIQKEVADRILAAPGGKEYGALSVGVRAVAEVDRLFNVSKHAFWPPPDVMSTVIRLTPRVPRGLSQAEERDLRALTRVAFSWRRKQLQKILRSAPAYALSSAGVAELGAATALAFDARPESLAPEQFVRLARALRARGLPAGDAAGAPEPADAQRRMIVSSDLDDEAE